MDPLDSKIYSKYERNQDCPCGSSLKAKKCCLQSNGLWNKKVSNVNPKQPESNFKNEKCYCGNTNNCDEEITREHYISKSIILYINNNTKTATIAGLPWIEKGTEKLVSVESLTTKTLCRRHNNAFSPLDSSAAKLFAKIGQFDSSFLNENNCDEISIFCGEDIEKWMLKTVCGFVSAKQIGFDGKVKNTVIKQIWIDILTGKVEWPKNWGLYINLQPGEEISHRAQTFSFVPKTNPETDDLLAAEFLINNITFNLILGNPDNPQSFGIHRPRTLIFHDKKIKKYIELSWQDQSYSKYVSLERKGTYIPDK